MENIMLNLIMATVCKAMRPNTLTHSVQLQIVL